MIRKKEQMNEISKKEMDHLIMTLQIRKKHKTLKVYVIVFSRALGHTVHCLGHGFKSGLPIGSFLSDMLILF